MTDYIPNPGQAAALNAELSQSVCIIAGAGTGKTETLARRYVRILKEAPQIHPRNIVVLTFTEKAATEMRARITDAVQAAQLPFSRLDMAVAPISTFHSFAARLALTQSITLDLDPLAPFCDEQSALALADECWQEFLAYGWQSAFAHAQHALADSVPWDEDKYAQVITGMIADIKGLAFDQVILAQQLKLTAPHATYVQALGEALLWNFVRRGIVLSQRGQLDLDDIIGIMPRLVAQLPALQHDIRYVMVDEYQDTSAAQAHMLHAITPRHNNKLQQLTVVGDPRQAIYVWRQAQVSNMIHMREQSDLPVHLVENRRSFTPILQVANASLRNYEFATPAEFDAKALLIPATRTASSPADCVKIYRYASQVLEAQAIAARMYELHTQFNVSYGEMALLLKRRTYIDTYTNALLAAGIPFDRGKSDPFYHRSLVLDAIHLALAVVAPHNEQSLTRALLALRVVNDVTLAQIRIDYRHRLWESMHILAAQYTPIANFIDLQRDFAHRQWYLDPAEWLLQLLQASKLWEQASAYGQRMLTKLINECRAVFAPDVPALLDVLRARIMHDPDSASPELKSSQNAVQILTVHAAKGLEFVAVFVADGVAYYIENTEQFTFQPGFLLHTKSDDQAHATAEFRRQARNELTALWYVALTRAKRWLMITAYQQKRNSKNLFSDLYQYVAAHPIAGVECGEIAHVTPISRVVPTTQPVMTVPPRRIIPTPRRIITLSPTALHEFTICPRRYRFTRRCGLNGIDEVIPTQPESSVTMQPVVVGAHFIPVLAVDDPIEEPSTPMSPPSELYQSANARILGTLFHAALELHASLGGSADAERLCQQALQRYGRVVPAAIQAELAQLVGIYLVSPLAQHIPSPHQVEQAMQWQIDTDVAQVEIRCVIDRYNDTHIIDYKTDHDIHDIAQRHGDQLRINAMALRQREPQHQDRELLVYHARSGQLIRVDNSPEAMTTTRARIAQAASWIVAARYPATPQPRICGHCPAREWCPEGQSFPVTAT